MPHIGDCFSLTLPDCVLDSRNVRFDKYCYNVTRIEFFLCIVKMIESGIYLTWPQNALFSRNAPNADLGLFLGLLIQDPVYSNVRFEKYCNKNKSFHAPNAS